MTTADERARSLEQAIRLKRAAAGSPRAPELPPRPADEAPRLSEMQHSLWLLHQMDPRSPAYNLASAFRVRGVLEVDELRRAFGEVVARHRLLHSTFRRHHDTVLQVVEPSAEVTFDVLEVATGSLTAAATEEARQPFDLQSGPLVRLRLIRQPAGDESLLLLVLHHILADERSLGLLWEDLATAYRGALSDSPAAAVQYDDYVAWAKRHEREKRRQGLDYWRQRLDPLPETLRLPFESPITAAEKPAGRLEIRGSSSETLAAVRRLAAATGTTPVAVFAFAFRLLLERYSEGQRIGLATPASTRSHPATADMVGYFLNPVVLYTGVDEERSVAEAVAAFGGELREMLGHAAIPFQTLVEELEPPRQPDRQPLFQTMFVHQAATAPPRLGAARLEAVTLDLGESKFDLTLFVDEGESSLEIAVEYRADRFAAVWMNGLLDHYETLLRNLPEGLDRAVSEVAMIGEDEGRGLQEAASGAALEDDDGSPLPRRIHQRARSSPRRPALVCGGQRWSYGQLASAAGAIAGRLEAAGVRPGDRVGLFVERSPWMIAGLLGGQWAGAAYVPLDPSYPPTRSRQVLEDADVAAVLTSAAVSERLPEGAWPTLDVTQPVGGEAPSESSPVEVLPDSIAYILYTSGSTGRPKGVVVSHDNLRLSTAARLQVYEEPPGTFLLLPSVAFDSSVAGIFWTLAEGGTLVLPTDDEIRDPRRLAALIDDEQVSSLLCVPSLYAQLLGTGGGRLESLDRAIVAGESCSARVVEEHFRQLPGVRLFNEYGPTEATVWATVGELDKTAGAHSVPIGRPIPGVRLEVLDRSGRPVPAGIPGEAWITGPTVAQGYWRQSELTAERFHGDQKPAAAGRRFRTGDRMAWGPDGQLLFLGREDEQIKLRGFRIEPGEIEAALVELSGVEQAAVVARPLGQASQAVTKPSANRLVAFVQGSAAGDDWRRRLADRLPEAMVPSRLEELPALPKLPNGKVDRRRLREMPLSVEARTEPDGLPPSDREQSLISLWQGLLGVSDITPNDNFFELGGHSLLVFEMILAIERDFETTLTPAEVFASPTARQLARRLADRDSAEAPAYEQLFPIQPGGRATPFIVAIPHFFTDLLATRFRDERPVYGLRGVGLRQEGNLGRWRTMRELGRDLVDEIDRRFPDRPCIVAGYSFGASMAVEAVHQLESRGREVEGLYLIAPMPVDVYRLGPVRLQIDGLRQPVDELSAPAVLRRYLRANHPFTLRPYRRAWRRLAIEPWRRLLCQVGRLRLAAGLPLTPGILYADVRVDRFRLHASYRPGTVRAPTVVFNAREPETYAAATWRPFFAGPFTVIETPDPHLDDASVETTRRLILEQLAELPRE